MLVGAIAYFVVPDDLIPDYIPLIGYADDAAVLAAAIKMVSLHIKPEHREAAQRTLARLRRRCRHAVITDVGRFFPSPCGGDGFQRRRGFRQRIDGVDMRAELALARTIERFRSIKASWPSARA